MRSSWWIAFCVCVVLPGGRHTRPWTTPAVRPRHMSRMYENAKKDSSPAFFSVPIRYRIIRNKNFLRTILLDLLTFGCFIGQLMGHGEACCTWQRISIQTVQNRRVNQLFAYHDLIPKDMREWPEPVFLLSLFLLLGRVHWGIRQKQHKSRFV